MIRYGKSLYKDTDVYKLLRFGNRGDWLKGRLTGIGGSDASAAISHNRWKSARDLWAIKTGREQQEDISDRPVVRYGTDMEHVLRESFAIKHRDQYSVEYMKDVTLQNNAKPFMLYSPDGLLVEKKTGRNGILEIKTHQVSRNSGWKDWDGKIGMDEYFIQVLHGLNVTGFDFVEMIVELRSTMEYQQIRTYHIERSDEGIEDTLQYIDQGVTDFWNNYILTDTEPPVIKYL